MTTDYAGGDHRIKRAAGLPRHKSGPVCIGHIDPCLCFDHVPFPRKMRPSIASKPRQIKPNPAMCCVSKRSPRNSTPRPVALTGTFVQKPKATLPASLRCGNPKAAAYFTRLQLPLRRRWGGGPPGDGGQASMTWGRTAAPAPLGKPPPPA